MALLATWTLSLLSCGDHGLLPGAIDPGADFVVADVVFDSGFYYCRVEPVLVTQRCGPGDPAAGDPANGCHHNVTSFRLTEYMPLVAERCNGGVTPAGGSIPAAAQQNYQSAQARMKRDPGRAQLLLRATGQTKHPRALFSAASSEAEVIRQWATQYSTQ